MVVGRRSRRPCPIWRQICCGPRVAIEPPKKIIKIRQILTTTPQDDDRTTTCTNLVLLFES